MDEAPYFIELRGGRFDGIRQPLQQMPAETRIEIRTDLPGSQKSKSPLSYLTLYERRQVVFVSLNGTPAMVLKYDFIGTRATPHATIGG